MVDPAGEGSEAQETPGRGWRPAVLVPFVIVAIVVFASFNLVLPYYALAPGSATQVNDLIEVPDDRSHPPDGQVLFTTVSLYPARPVDALVGWIRSDTELIPREKLLPPETTSDEYRELNAELMDESKQAAIVVALRRLGHAVTAKGEGALVVQALEGFPASPELKSGDVITAVDGRPVSLFDDAVRAIRVHAPGERVRLDVRAPDGGTRSVGIVLAENPQVSGEAFLGAQMRTSKPSYDTPFPVSIRTSNVGGPSAGLAFTLALIDQLTAGELTGGRKVAVTGTISLDGTVGDVGGVAQKTRAVEAAGSKVFLVPPGEYEEAKRAAGGDVEIYKVATLQEALDALGRLGGDLRALGPPPVPTRG